MGEKILYSIKLKDSKYMHFSWIWELVLIIFLSAIGSFSLVFLINKSADGEVGDIGFLVAGVIAGLVSLLVSFNNKESELNKYRVKWCDDVRVLSHAYISEVSAIHVSMCLLDMDYTSNSSKLMYYYDSFEENVGFDSIKTVEEKKLKIELLLGKKNENDVEGKVYKLFNDLHSKFLDIVVEVHVLGSSFKSGSVVKDLNARISGVSADFNDLESSYITPLKEEISIYLNSEWNKIKFGGFWFRVKRCVMISLIMVFFISFVYKIGIDKTVS